MATGTDLIEIDGEAVEIGSNLQHTEPMGVSLARAEIDVQIATARRYPRSITRVAKNIRDLVSTGSMPLRDELLTRYRPTMLELLRLPGMGPKTVALLWSALEVADINSLEAAAKAGAWSSALVASFFHGEQVTYLILGVVVGVIAAVGALTLTDSHSTEEAH